MSPKSRAPSIRSQGTSATVPKPTAELIVLHRPAKSIPKWWQTSQILCYFMCIISGIAVCISLGRIKMAFGEECILYGKVSVTRRPTRNLRLRHIDTANTIWGSPSDCDYCQFLPMGGACAALILAVLFLEFGSSDMLARGKRSTRDNTWKLVIPGIIVSLVFFIMSCISLANTVGGLFDFCEHVLENSNPDLNLTSCSEVYHLTWEIYRLPNNLAVVDVYLNVLISEIGASLHFAGWFLSLLILMARCGSSADFIVKSKPFRSPGDSFETLPVVFNDDNDDDSFSSGEEDDESVFISSDGGARNPVLIRKQSSSTA